MTEPLTRSKTLRNAAAAMRQQRFRERRDVLVRAVDDLIAELSHAADDSGCSWITDNLPEERQAQIEALTDRLRTARVIAIRGVRNQP